MFEGSPTSRKPQIITGTIIGVLGLPFLSFGAFAISTGITDGFPKIAFIILSSFCLILGVLSVLMSYRLITARGIKKGGDLLTPLTYKIMGYLFAGMSLLFFAFTVSSSNISGLIGAGCSILLSYWCFVAS